MRAEPYLSATGKALQAFMGEIRPFEGQTGKRAYIRQAYNMRFGPKPAAPGQAMLVRQTAGFPQALVKVVRNGGTRTAQGLLGQAAYLAREGDVQLRDSPLGDVGWALSGEELEEKLLGWAENWRGNPRLGHTTHMIVSYPKGTDPLAARDAARFFPERSDFQPFAKNKPAFDYVQDAYRFDGILPPDAQDLGAQRYARAEAAIMEKARSLGIDLEKVVGRYEANRPVNGALAARWGRDEASDVLRHRPDLSQAQAVRQVADYHRFVQAQYLQANRDIEALARARGVEVAPVLKRPEFVSPQAPPQNRARPREGLASKRDPSRDDE